MEKDSAKYIDLAQAEQEFGVDAKTLYRQIKAGNLPAYKPFGKHMVKRKDAVAFANAVSPNADIPKVTK